MRLRDLTEQRDFGTLKPAYRSLRSTEDEIRFQTGLSKLTHRMLGRFSLGFSAHDRDVRDVALCAEGQARINTQININVYTHA